MSETTTAFQVVIDEGSFMPERAHSSDAGYDLRTPKAFVLPAHGSAVCDTGVHIEIPDGCVGMLKSKSGLNVKHNIICTGTIDAGYTGSIAVKLYNLGDEDYEFAAGDKITQIVFIPIVRPVLIQVAELDLTERGPAGMGSTGR